MKWLVTLKKSQGISKKVPQNKQTRKLRKTSRINNEFRKVTGSREHENTITFLYTNNEHVETETKNNTIIGNHSTESENLGIHSRDIH